jgi:ribosomal protein S18 acetylase RimI-like enzyme
MNSSTVDLTDVPGAAVDDQVIVVGSQDGEHIYLNDMARHSGTIAAELMVRFGQGVARRYVSPADKRDRWPFEPARGDEASWEIRYVTTEQDLPDGIGLQDVIRFLSRHLSPYDDPEAIIRRALDFSLGSYVGGRGFVLLALRDGELAGVLTCARTTTGGFLPDNIIGYVAVHREHRAMGIGSELVRRALSLVEGDAKLHVRHDNPARRFYERLGFDGKMVEMRYINGGRTLTWTR